MRRRGTVSLKLMFAPGNLMRWPRRRYRPMHQALPPSFESPRIAGVLAELSLASRFDSAPRGSVLRAIETGPEISIASLQESRSLLVGARRRPSSCGRRRVLERDRVVLDRSTRRVRQADRLTTASTPTRAGAARAGDAERYAPRGTSMKIATTCWLLFALLFGCGALNAKDYCPPAPKAEKEGDAWYIPESAFTKEAANKALQNLSTQINKGVKGRDYLIDNDLKMIKGYLFISYLAE